MGRVLCLRLTVGTSPSSLTHEDGSFRHSGIEGIFSPPSNAGTRFGSLENVVFGLHDCGFAFSLVPDTNNVALDHEVSIST